MKRLCYLVLCSFLIISSFSQVFASNDIKITDFKVSSNNHQFTLKNPILSKNNKLMLPLEEIMTNLDISYDKIECSKPTMEGYDSINIDISCDMGNIIMDNESTNVWVSGRSLDLDVPPLVYKNTVYVPLMYVSDVLGKKVVCDNNNSLINISDIVLPEPQGWIRLQNRPSGNKSVKVKITGSADGSRSTWISTTDQYKAVVIKDKIYMIDNDGTLKEYNPIFDKWKDISKISELKNSNGNFKLAVLNNKILIIGVNCSDIYQYDVETNKCRYLTSFPIEQVPASVIVAEGKVYILSGMYRDYFYTINTLDMYNPNTDKWTKKKDMFEGLSDLAAVYYNGEIYIFGGEKSTTKYEDLIEEDPVTGEIRLKQNSDTNKCPGQNIEAYDIKTDTWSYKSPDNFHWFADGSEVCNGKLYLFGYEFNNDNQVYCVKEYDPVNNKYSKVADMLPKTDLYSTVTLNGEIFIICGKSVEKYIPHM